MQAIIEANKLSKSYNKGKTAAVTDISFSVEEGEIYGLIGPDGAGKSSIFRMLCTLILPDTGSGSVAGFDILKDYRKIRSLVGYMPGRFSLYQDLSVEENLHFFASLFGTSVRENYSLIRDIYIQLEPFKTRRAGQLSGGMKQKLALCCALIHKPRVLLLDEPTTGVDAVSRKEFWEMLSRLKEQGISILVSTPYMDEASLCDRIGLIQNGKMLSVNTPENIIRSYPFPLYSVSSDQGFQISNDVKTFEGISSAYAFGQSLHVTFKEKEEAARLLKLHLEKIGHTGLEIKAIQPGIEDCFIRLMN